MVYVENKYGFIMIYLNNAATSYPKPQEVIERVMEVINEMPGNSARSGLDKEDTDNIYSARIKVANFFNISNPVQVVFTSGSTEALNMAIKGIEPEGSHIISTKIEHNSVIRPLKTLEMEGQIEVDFVDCDEFGYVPPENFENAIKENTKAIVVNHCSNVTGAYLNLKEIGEIAQKHNCYFIVDASQSAGCLPVDFTDSNIDLLAFTGHKSFFGLPGSGGLLIKEGMTLKPLKTGGTGIKSEVLLQPSEMPLWCEAGTPNTPGIVSISAGIDFINNTGMDKISGRKKEHLKRMVEELSPLEEITIYNHPEHSSWANFCFNIKNMVPEEVNYVLESSYDIHVRSGLHCAPMILEPLGVHPWGTVRASPSFFTTDEELDKFIFAIKEIVDTFVRKIK